MIQPGTIWLVGGVVLCLAEILQPGVFLLWCGIGAIGTGLVTYALSPILEAQLACFVIFTAAALMIPFLRRKYRPQPQERLNVPESDLIGETCRAKEFDGREGRVDLRDGSWRARMTEGDSPAEGTLLRITGREGTVLLVSRDAG